MKAWKVCYSTKTTDGKITDFEAKVKADTITEALMQAEKMIPVLTLLAPVISDFVIWDIGIMQPDVF